MVFPSFFGGTAHHNLVGYIYSIDIYIYTSPLYPIIPYYVYIYTYILYIYVCISLHSCWSLVKSLHLRWLIPVANDTANHRTPAHRSPYAMAMMLPGPSTPPAPCPGSNGSSSETWPWQPTSHRRYWPISYSLVCTHNTSLHHLVN